MTGQKITNTSECALVIKRDGTLWAWGRNVYGQLGDGTTIDKSSPIKIGNLTNWASIGFSSRGESYAIKTDGTLWAWGGSGLNISGYKSSPVQVGSLTNWRLVVGGYDHAVAIKTDGTLWGWGNGTYGALGTGDTSIYTSPVQIGVASNWSTVSCGAGNTFAIKNDGTLWATGYNGDGSYGIGDTTSRSSLIQVGSGYATISCCNYGLSYNANLAIKTDGTLWATGYNSFGQLGDGTTTQRSTRVQIGALTNWANISTGLQIIAIKTDGSIWGWGYNASGELGLGDQISRSSPTRIGLLNTWEAVAACKFFSLGIK